MREDETLIIIRSLLSSCKEPMNVASLNKEFKDETGVDIPLHAHRNIIDFLKSIPETVTLTGEYPNEKVQLVTSKKSAHIVSLVKKQKYSQKENKPVKKALNLPTVPSSNRSKITPFGEKPRDKINDKYLHQYLLSCPNGATSNEIKCVIKETTNLDLPMKYYNIFNFVKSYPFTVFYNGKFYALNVFKKKLKFDK